MNFKEVLLFLKRSLYAPVQLFRLLGTVVYQYLLYSSLNLELESTYTSFDIATLPEILQEINILSIFA